jgi:DNA-binding GntR family transcriptional regulator
MPSKPTSRKTANAATNVVTLTPAPASQRDAAYETLLEAIIFGDLPPGSSADEKQVSRKYGLGLSSVRSAMHRLSLEGIVERHPRIGTRIPELGLRELEDVFEARVIIEGSCAALSAKRASGEDVARLRAAFADFEEVIRRRDFQRLVRMDQAFHRALAAATSNKALERQLITLHNNALRFWYFGLPRLEPSVLRADIEAHLDVVRAIEARDPAAAKRAMSSVLGRFPTSVGSVFAGAIARMEKRHDERSQAGGRDRKRPKKGARAI